MNNRMGALRLAVAQSSSVITRTTASINSKGELMIYGVIGDWWDELDAETVVRQAEVASNESDQLIVRVHSEGGNVMDGLAIYNALKQSDRQVIIYVDGIAASMASAVVCAGDIVRMPSNALMMIHKPAVGAWGNSDDHRDIADQLEVLEGSYISCYAEKGNQTAEQITALISDGKDHWLTAEQCLEMGFCDEILAEPVAIAATFKCDKFHNPPAALWGNLVVKPKAAAAVNIPEKKAMLFKIVALLAGGASLAANIMAALVATFVTMDDAVAALTHLGIGDLEKVLSGEIQASDAVLNQIGDALNLTTGDPGDPAGAEGATASLIAADAAVARERTRVSGIRAMGKKHGLTEVQIGTFTDTDISLADARSATLDIVAARSAAAQPVPGVRVSYPQGEQINTAMAQAIMNRSNPSIYKLDEASKPFAFLSLIEMARAHLQMNGVSVEGMAPGAIAAMAMQTTSDFVNILADVANKSLRRGYEAAPRTFTAFTRQVTAADFKPINRVQIGSGGGSLKKVNEKGEFKHGTLVDGKETYSLGTYGEILAVSRQTLINDDLDSLSRIPMMQGAQVAETESEVVWGLITGNAKLSDNVALFHASHGNLGSGVIGDTSLTEARKKMRTQKKLDKSTPMNLAPAYMMVPAALETVAQKFLANITAQQAGNVNPFASSVELLVEARLDADSEIAWYQAADPNRIDTIEYAYLEGQEGAYMETRPGFGVDGVEMKVRLDFAAGLIDHRGLYKSTGA